MQVETRISIEKKIGAMIVENALTLGYTVTVFDGEENAVTKCDDAKVLKRHMFQTDEETLRFWKDGKRVGSVLLIYGNSGWDVICDYTDVPEIVEILKPASEYAEKMEEKYC